MISHPMRRSTSVCSPAGRGRSPSLVGVVLDRFGRDAILVPDGEEHFTVTVPAVVSPQFLGWVFGLGDGVQILRPDWAAEELKRQLAAVAALYQ